MAKCSLMLEASAKRVLCIQAWSTQSELLFSDAGNVFTDKRICFQEDKPDELLFKVEI